MVKVTFTLDDETVGRLRRVAARLAKPQSQVVREAVKEYEARADRLGEEDRRRMLEAFDTFLAKTPPRPRREVQAELHEIRAARREGWRDGPAKRRR